MNAGLLLRICAMEAKLTTLMAAPSPPYVVVYVRDDETCEEAAARARPLLEDGQILMLVEYEPPLPEEETPSC